MSLFSQSYYAKVEPLQKYNVVSSVAGEVTFADDSQEGKISKDAIIKIDNDLDLSDYALSKSIYENLKSIYESKLSIYEKIESMSTKSQIEKDNEKIALLNAKNSMLNADLKVKTLKDRLDKKSIKQDGLYVYKINVRKGDFVNPGTKLAELYDTSGSRLVIFADKDDINAIEKKGIIVDGKSGLYKIDKLFKIADSEFISNYRVELVGPAVKKYSDIILVEIPKEVKK